jgi:alkylation response protein AidB-like acyl-CoA dehydrogenase
MAYRAPLNDFHFLFNHVVGLDQVTATELFSEAKDDVTTAILAESGRLCEDILAPLQRNGDTHPAHLENGVVRTSPGFSEGYRAIAEGGWIGMSAPEARGGMGLPQTITTAVNDMMSSACLALQLNPLMSQGQIEAIDHHASDELKAIYLPKLISGEWCGTMNLTEPQAGSDVGALRSKAEPNGHGTYAITGQKIYISWADNDFTSNVCHLVLARLPDGGPGTKGISLFMVPKYIPDANGVPGKANSLKVVSLEHKMGLHGSPTAVMQYDGATGWLVGEAHQGMRTMFTMMNNARLGVGVQGIGVAEGAYQHALAYAVAIDMGRATGDADWQARAAFLTPIAKAFGTDVGCEVSHLGVQVHGGMGYIEETGAAQYARDVRVTAIYEGTNGIQAMDLVARKLADDGEAAYRLLDEIEETAEAARVICEGLSRDVWRAAEGLRETTEWLVEQKDLNDRFAGAVPFLRAFARILGAHYHLKSAIVEGGHGPRSRLARFYIDRMLPEYAGLLAHADQGAAGLYALSVEDLTG